MLVAVPGKRGQYLHLQTNDSTYIIRHPTLFDTEWTKYILGWEECQSDN